MAEVKSLTINGVDIDSKLQIGGCSASGNGDTIALSAGVITQVPLTQMDATDGDMVGLSDGGIKILRSGMYLICGSVYMQVKGNSGYSGTGVYIKDSSGTEINSCLGMWATVTTANYNGSVSVAPKLVYLEENTILYLNARVTQSTATLYTGNAATYLTVLRVGITA